MASNARSLKRKLYSIVREKIQETDAEEASTNVDAIETKVKASSSIFLRQILDLLASQMLRLIISKLLKHDNQDGFEGGRAAGGGGGGSGGGKARPPQPKQQVFPDIPELEGYPKRLTYPDPESKVKRIKFVQSPKSRKFDRNADEKYDDLIKDRHLAKNRRKKTGNEFLAQLVEKYGDLDAQILIEKWKQDGQTKAGDE